MSETVEPHVDTVAQAAARQMIEVNAQVTHVSDIHIWIAQALPDAPADPDAPVVEHHSLAGLAEKKEALRVAVHAATAPRTKA